jgi:hypothetical protein
MILGAMESGLRLCGVEYWVPFSIYRCEIAGHRIGVVTWRFEHYIILHFTLRNTVQPLFMRCSCTYWVDSAGKTDKRCSTISMLEDLVLDRTTVCVDSNVHRT